MVYISPYKDITASLMYLQKHAVVGVSSHYNPPTMYLKHPRVATLVGNQLPESGLSGASNV